MNQFEQISHLRAPGGAGSSAPRPADPPSHGGEAAPRWYLMEDVNSEKAGALRRAAELSTQLSGQLMRVQERERQRIAADLHDGIGQSLSLIKLSTETALQLMKAGEHQAAVDSLQRIVGMTRDAMAELRRTLADLHPAMLDDLGIIPTMTWFFREFELACRGKKIEKDFSVSESDVPIQLRAPIFRILQEAMNNITKHANADLVKVALKVTGPDLEFSIQDNGQGFDPTRLLASRKCGTGLGLQSMKERAISSDGVFEIKSGPGQGTRILVRWPLAQDNCADGGLR